MFGTGCISNHSHLLWLFTLLADSFVCWHNKWLTLPLVAGHAGAARKPKCLLSFIEQYGMYYTVYFHCCNIHADGLWWGAARELSPTGTISMGNRVRNRGRQLLCACVCRDRFCMSVDGRQRSWTYQGVQTSCALSEWWLEGNCYLFVALCLSKTLPLEHLQSF